MALQAFTWARSPESSPDELNRGHQVEGLANTRERWLMRGRTVEFSPWVRAFDGEAKSR